MEIQRNPSHAPRLRDGHGHAAGHPLVNNAHHALSGTAGALAMPFDIGSALILLVSAPLSAIGAASCLVLMLHGARRRAALTATARHTA